MYKRELYYTMAMHNHTLQVHNMLLHICPDILQDFLIAYHQIKEKVNNLTQCLLHKMVLNGPAKNKFFEHKTQYNENTKQ